ncbi:SpoIIE family protein phosphatase [Streptomyces sp. XD-27]|uniref:SpoIIE family protein phosphatase n=1 Tax=Streptomyces sp. XD-27 TaxID=3062779 RepID=UPI0026F41D7F|nr:SpoIIE family protein phosphatase [Streptomyces sp. XD-27]WKX74218.1 SpoIIE family protein phosphatase [Streptomyces sp. XD-27]
MNAPFDLAPAVWVVIDGEGAVIGWTYAAERLLGYRAAEVLDRPAAMLLASPDDAAKAAAIAEECRAGAVWAGLVAARHLDGSRVELGLRVCAVMAADGREQWLVSAIDLASTPSWAVSGSVLEGFLTRSPLGMAVLSPELRYVWLNDTLERFGGVPRKQRLGRRMTSALPGLDTAALEALIRRVLATGVPVIDHEYQGWTAADPHREHAYSTSFFRLEDADGHPMGVYYLVMDVTDRWKAQRRLALLNEAGVRIGSTLDVARTAEEVAAVAVPRVADFVTVDLLEAVLRGDEPAVGPSGVHGALRRAAQLSIHEGCPESVVAVGDPVGAPEAAPYERCVAEGRSIREVVDPARPSPTWLAEDPARSESVREYGMHSGMWVPLRARGTVLGVVTFVRSRHPDPFEDDDQLLAEELVARAAVCLDNARRYTREHNAALALQRTLLPHRLTGGAALDVATRYLPTGAQGGVGGDWFDVIPLSGGRVALVVGDVVGHGITAAATMGRLRTAVHTLADMDLSPDELLAHLDDLVIRLTEEEHDDAVATAVLGATCLYAVYDPVTRRCAMARAGHPAPAIVDPGGAVSFPSLPAGPPLGLGSLPFECAELELSDGSVIALFTNGLIGPADDNVDLRLRRLGRALAQPELPLEELCTAVVDSMLSGPPDDDVALLVARTRGLDAHQVASWDLPADPAVVSSARAMTDRQLAEWGLDELRMTTELVVSELVTNAIRHAVGPIRLRLIRHEVLVCEVADASSTSPRLRHARTTDEGGRGLFLIAQLTRRWGTRYTRGGKIIWTEQELPSSPSARG